MSEQDKIVMEQTLRDKYGIPHLEAAEDDAEMETREDLFV